MESTEQKQPRRKPKPRRSQIVYLGDSGMSRLNRLVLRLDSGPSEVVKRALLELEERVEKEACP
jgi:hypothetical protein